MRRAYRPLASFVARIRWVVLIKVALSVVILVYGASITVTSNNYQAEIGSATTVANNLKATDKGFTLATSGTSAAGTACSSPITFGASPGTANTAITSGHLVYDVQINSTNLAPTNTKFNVTFVLAGTTYGPLCIQTPASPANGQTIDCKYDVGTSLPSSPFTFKVTVQ